MSTRILPWTGYFAIDPDGQARDGYKKGYRYKIPQSPAIRLDAIVTPICRTSEFSKPFKSFLVETLAYVRDHQPARAYSGVVGVIEWLEGNGLLKAVAIEKDDPLLCNILYEVTGLGFEFLERYEAPEDW